MLEKGSKVLIRTKAFSGNDIITIGTITGYDDKTQNYRVYANNETLYYKADNIKEFKGEKFSLTGQFDSINVGYTNINELDCFDVTARVLKLTNCISLKSLRGAPKVVANLSARNSGIKTLDYRYGKVRMMDIIGCPIENLRGCPMTNSVSMSFDYAKDCLFLVGRCKEFSLFPKVGQSTYVPIEAPIFRTKLSMIKKGLKAYANL